MFWELGIQQRKGPALKEVLVQTQEIAIHQTYIICQFVIRQQMMTDHESKPGEEEKGV